MQEKPIDDQSGYVCIIWPSTSNVRRDVGTRKNRRRKTKMTADSTAIDSAVLSASPSAPKNVEHNVLTPYAGVSIQRVWAWASTLGKACQHADRVVLPRVKHQ